MCGPVQEIFRAGLETTSSTTEWALTELLCNPATLIEAKAELTQFHGIPKDTQVFVNAYAIGRDRDVWREEPMSSKPERFVVLGVCDRWHNSVGSVGIPLAHRMLHLTLGMLLQRFDWSLDANVTRETMDWKDKLGITMTKSEPLLAVP
ncbi:hypothetical protein ACFXTN_008613 [Malus domestica]